ncbi:hypothetical protein MMC31_007419 [Peltigera leucophlebia]|nr:hypothetical protein [Peltigera leucophlebia]
MVELGTTDIKNDRMSDLVDRSAKKTQLAHPFSGPSTLSDFVFQVPVVPTAPLISASPSQNDKKIDNLTDMMRSLAFSVRTLQGSTNVPLVASQSEPQPANTSSESRMRTNYRGTGSGKSWPERVNRLPSAEVHTLRIGVLEPDPDSSDEEEDDYISLDTPLTTIVSAARSNHAKPSEVSEKEPIKQILRKRIQKEKGYATPKNIRFGAYEPEKGAPIPPSPAPIETSTPEEAMLDVDPVTKKSLERKKQPRVVHVLKESVGATTITKRIIALGVSLTVGELLASAPAVEKQLTKAISEDEAVQFRANSVDIGNPVHIKDSWYSMGSPKIKVRLEDGPKVRALLNTGAEINVMTREVMEDAGLAMRKGPKLELVSHTGHSRPFLGLCEDVEVAIGGLKTRHPIFVVEHGDRMPVLEYCEVSAGI